MSITKEQQQALDDALVPREQRLQIGSCNYRLSTTFKPKEPTFQVALDVLSLIPFYPAFLITASICPKIPGQQFVDPLFEEEILTFMRELGYPRNIKLLSDVKVDILPQPWRTFKTIINKCLSKKVTGIDSLRLFRAKIIWGLYHQQKVDYAYLLWEDLVFQIENKELRKNKYMFYLRFTKVVINHFMSQDQSIPRRNKVDWHMDNDDPILTTMRFIPQHEVVQKYGAILPDNLTTQAKKESKAYKTYYAFSTRKAIPKPNSQPSSSGAHEGICVTPGFPDVPTYGFDDEQISWKSSDEEDDDDEANIGKDEDDDDQDDDDDQEDNDDQDNDNDQDDGNEFDLDNDGDDFVHPKISTHDEEEDSFNPRVQTPSHVESTNDQDSDEEIQGVNVEGDKQDKEETNEEVEENELYRNVNVNLEGRDIEMTNAQHTNVQCTQVTEDTHVIITTPVNPEGINSIFNFNTESTSLVDVPVTAIVEPPLLLKTLENNFSEFNQTNQFAVAVSSILGIVDAYFANKMHEAVKTVVQLQSERLKDEAQAENADFINKLDDNIKKVIKNQVKKQVKAQTSYAVAANLSKLDLKKILIHKMESNKSIHRSNEQKNLYKALIDAYKSDKLILNTYRDVVSFKICRDDEDKDEEPSARSNRGSKRRRARKEPESTSAPKEKTSKTTGKSTEGSKSHHKSAGESAQAEEPTHTTKDLEEPAHHEFEIGVIED
ncbi:putative ribonuclease H-like domain-containing protein [Tanacetum coccineum]